MVNLPLPLSYTAHMFQLLILREKGISLGLSCRVRVSGLLPSLRVVMDWPFCNRLEL